MEILAIIQCGTEKKRCSLGGLMYVSIVYFVIYIKACLISNCERSSNQNFNMQYCIPIAFRYNRVNFNWEYFNIINR